MSYPRSAMKRSGRVGGFTLIEVMVALAISAIGLAGVSIAIAQKTDTARKLRDRTLALYVAGNHITQLRLAGEFLDAGRRKTETEFASQTFLLTTNIQNTDIETLRRVDVSVSAAWSPEVSIRTVSGFITSAQPMPVGTAPSFDDLTRVSGQTN